MPKGVAFERERSSHHEHVGNDHRRKLEDTERKEDAVGRVREVYGGVHPTAPGHESLEYADE